VKLSSLDKDGLSALSKEYHIAAADTKGHALHSFELQEKTIIIIGNEGRGITKETETYVNQRVKIPSARTNQSDSLNAGISASIIMYEIGIKKTGK
jgi:tRNA G18 (ribose-2'-O)-methylase SpoU